MICHETNSIYLIPNNYSCLEYIDIPLNKTFISVDFYQNERCLTSIPYFMIEYLCEKNIYENKKQYVFFWNDLFKNFENKDRFCVKVNSEENYQVTFHFRRNEINRYMFSIYKEIERYDFQSTIVLEQVNKPFGILIDSSQRLNEISIKWGNIKINMNENIIRNYAKILYKDWEYCDETKNIVRELLRKLLVPDEIDLIENKLRETQIIYWIPFYLHNNWNTYYLNNDNNKNNLHVIVKVPNNLTIKGSICILRNQLSI